MKVYQCDRCHTQFTDRYKIKTVSIEGLAPDKEFCNDCIEALIRFLIPKEIEKASKNDSQRTPNP